MARKRNKRVQEQLLAKISAEWVRFSGYGGGAEPEQEHRGGSDVAAEVAGPGQSATGEQVGGKTDD